MCAAALLLGVALAGARSITPEEKELASTETTASATEKSGGEDSDKPVRPKENEELVDQIGQFSLSGDRVAFTTTAGRHRFLVLENQSLEHVAKSLSGDSPSKPWKVSGKITEFRGTLYLLLTRTQPESPRP
jgi:hypothetical protein